MEQTTPDNSQLELLQQFLADRDEPCPVCGYNLRGLQSEHCPECGARIEMKIGSSDLRLRYWIATVVLFALPIGFALPMLVSQTIFVLQMGITNGIEIWSIVLFAATALLFAILLAISFRKRRQFWMATVTVQRLILAGCVALLSGVAAGYVIVFGYIV